MKKIYITIIIVIMGLCACANNNDGFFGSWDNHLDDRAYGESTTLRMPRTELNSPDNDDAPLGSGLLIMTTLGTAYMLSRKKRIVK